MSISRTRQSIAPYKPLTDEDVRKVVNETRQGKTNNGGVVTLTANSATTTVSDPLITKNSVLHFTPRTSNAKAEGIPYYDETTDLSEGSVVLHHDNAVSSDRSYLVTISC